MGNSFQTSSNKDGIDPYNPEYKTAKSGLILIQMTFHCEYLGIHSLVYEQVPGKPVFANLVKHFGGAYV